MYAISPYRSVNCPQASLSTNTLCHILKVSSRLLIAPKTTPPAVTTEYQALVTKLQSPERLSVQGASTCEYHTSSRTPGHDSKSRGGKLSRALSSYQLSPTAAGQPLPGHVMKEHAFIAQVVLNIVGARLPSQVGMTRDLYNIEPLSHSRPFILWTQHERPSNIEKNSLKYAIQNYVKVR